MITSELIRAVRHQFALDWQGIHGIRHWTRVFANGTLIARTTQANIRVVQLFALFHDSCRQSEGADPEHGPRGAELALHLHGSLFFLDKEELHLLVEACRYHTTELNHPDPTVAACFDADRLDLGRVGNMPDPKLLCTEKGRQPATIEEAYERSLSDYLPENIFADHLHI